MIWPWKREAAKQEAALQEAKQRVRALDSNWEVIMEEVIKSRHHRHQNHIMELIIGVARGDR